SSASSIPSLPFTSFTPKKQIGLTRSPMIKDAHTGTNPAPGVIATSPITRPVDAPTRVGFPDVIVSITIQETRAAAAERDVVMNACAASPFAANALPAL